MEKEDMIRKVQGLLNLAEGHGNEAETAAAMATMLMRKWSIEMAELGVDDDEIAETRDFSEKFKKRPTWKGNLAAPIAKANGCSIVWQRDGVKNGTTRMRIAGRPSDIEIAKSIYDHCEEQVLFLTKLRTIGRSKLFKNNYRDGLIRAIADAIEREQEELKRKMQGKVSETALTIVDTRAEEAHELWGGTSRLSSNSTYLHNGHSQGVEDGKDIYHGTKGKIEN